MKRSIACVLAIIIVLSCAAPGYCNGPIRKLKRGVSNLVTFPLEMPHRIKAACNRRDAGDGFVYGFFQGLAMMAARLAAGMYETATFPFPIPTGYESLLDDPEFFWINEQHETK